MSSFIKLFLLCLLIIASTSQSSVFQQQSQSNFDVQKDLANDIDQYLRDQGIVPQYSTLQKVYPHNNNHGYTLLYTNDDNLYKVLVSQRKNGGFMVKQFQEIPTKLLDPNQKNLQKAQEKAMHNAVKDEQLILSKVLQKEMKLIEQMVQDQKRYLDQQESNNRIVNQFNSERLGELVYALNRN